MKIKPFRRILAGLATRWAGAALLAVAGTGVTAQAASLPTMAALPSLTEKETAADQIWSLRAGLNVAALQCQFSPFLMSAANYNALLRQHSDEFTDAFNTMNRYFVRLEGARKGARAFDTYATRTNQSFATFDAQFAFCDMAAEVARKALQVPKGKFGEFSGAQLRVLRESLTKTDPLKPLRQYQWASIPEIPPPCKGRRCR